MYKISHLAVLSQLMITDQAATHPPALMRLQYVIYLIANRLCRALILNTCSSNSWCVMSKSQPGYYRGRFLTTLFFCECDMRLSRHNFPRADFPLSHFISLLQYAICGANGSLPFGAPAFHETFVTSSPPATWTSQTWTLTWSNFFIWTRIWVLFKTIGIRVIGTSIQC